MNLVRRFSGWSCGESPQIMLVSRRTEENGQFNPSISTICRVIVLPWLRHCEKCRENADYAENVRKNIAENAEQ